MNRMRFGDERGYKATKSHRASSTLRLWFGDERGYNATHANNIRSDYRLWFGDERGYNATYELVTKPSLLLWFGDERGYNATPSGICSMHRSCGLVMKEDITQPFIMNNTTRQVVVW